jgi:uncharacterized protein YydD (DUF2326 family)
LEKATALLNEYLAFDILKQWSYRKSITYFLRSQKDYNDVFQLLKFSKGKDINVPIMNVSNRKARKDCSQRAQSFHQPSKLCVLCD